MLNMSVVDTEFSYLQFKTNAKQERRKYHSSRMNVTNPYDKPTMISLPTAKRYEKSYEKIFKKKSNKHKTERKRLKSKKNSPGIPPNTCPYIDLVQTMIEDLSIAYDKLYTKGEHNPVVDKIESNAKELLEYIRTNNETLRDNSLYWYNKYKDNL
tara:strand:+ start:2860 stop:3324 length:465 start_codon:yes stop_codon:yes gene_type:complete